MLRDRFRTLAALTLPALLAVPALAQQAQPAAAAASDDGKGILALVVAFVLAVVTLLISLGLAMFAVGKAIAMFDKTTKGMDEWGELRKGNVAVGILMAAMILAVGNVISGSVQGLSEALMHPEFKIGYLASLVVGIVNLLIGIWVATTVVSLAVKALDKMTKDIDEIAEIGKGNVAVAVMVAGVLLAVSVVVSQGVHAISKILDVSNIVSNLQAGI